MMCGIIGYKGFRNASEIVVEGLKKLEYRGYDSWGICMKRDNNLTFKKQVGKISAFNGNNLEESSLAIGHTRWCTHGKVSEENAHPHFSCDKSIAVVHNGIIENYKELREELKNHRFVSETDTEVIAHLIEEYIKDGFKEAVKKAISRLKGRYAIVVINNKNNELIAARNGSPLIIGVGEKEYFVASDIPAFLDYTNKVMYLDDEQMVVINDKLRFINLKSEKIVEKRVIKIEWEAKQADKAGYEHFMIKEIMEQKETIKKAVEQDDKKIIEIAKKINDAFGVFFVGCGTAGRVCLATEYFFSKIANFY